MRGLDHIHRMEPENLIKGKKKLGLTEYFTWAKHYTGCFLIIQLNVKIMLQECPGAPTYHRKAEVKGSKKLFKV